MKVLMKYHFGNEEEHECCYMLWRYDDEEEEEEYHQWARGASARNIAAAIMKMIR